MKSKFTEYTTPEGYNRVDNNGVITFVPNGVMMSTPDGEIAEVGIEKPGKLSAIHYPMDVAVGKEEEPISKEDKLKWRIEYWQERMGLLEWQVWGEFGLKDTDCDAKCSYDPLHQQAVIYIDEDYPENQWNAAVVHELLHLMFDPVSQYCEEILLHTDEKTRAVLDARFDIIFERAYNRAARAICGVGRPRMSSIG